MDDEQLLQFSPDQARQQLNEEQLERYNELKQKQLEEGIDEQKTEDAQNAVEGLEAMRQQVEDDIAVTVRGIKFSTDITPAQVDKLVELSRFEDKKPEELSGDQFNKVKNNVLDILAELSINHDRDDWDDHFGDAGIIVPARLAGEVLDEVEQVMNQKKSR